MSESMADTWAKVLKRDREALRLLAKYDGTNTSIAVGTHEQWARSCDRLVKLRLMRPETYRARLTQRGLNIVKWAAKHDPDGLAYSSLPKGGGY